MLIETFTWENKIKIKLAISYRSCTTSNTVRIRHCLNFYEKLTNTFLCLEIDDYKISFRRRQIRKSRKITPTISYQSKVCKGKLQDITIKKLQF